MKAYNVATGFSSTCTNLYSEVIKAGWTNSFSDFTGFVWATIELKEKSVREGLKMGYESDKFFSTSIINQSQKFLKQT